MSDNPDSAENKLSKRPEGAQRRADASVGPLSPMARAIDSAWPIACWQDCGVLLACSGGADSVALVCAVRELLDAAGPTAAGQRAGSVVVAHFNHKMRGGESDLDERFVEQLAETAGFLYCSTEYDPPPGTDRLSEESARNARYDFLVGKAEQSGARYLVTAHHAEDQAETVLHNLVRGTGLIGLGGMPEYLLVAPSVTLVRPLLKVRRKQIIEYLQARGQSFRVDGSNADIAYTRNRLRHEVLPLLEDCVPGDAVCAINRAAEAAREARLEIYGQADDLMRRAVRQRGDPPCLDLDLTAVSACSEFAIRSLWRYVWAVAKLPLQRMTAEHWRRLGELCKSEEPPSAKLNLPGGITAVREANRVIIEQPTPEMG